MSYDEIARVGGPTTGHIIWWLGTVDGERKRERERERESGRGHDDS